MVVFDRLVSNLADVYYHSNPEAKQVLASEHPPDLLYSLIWTLIFIDQNFRDPRPQSKVTCRYFVRLMQREGAGYPLECFDKRVLKNIYNDIRSRPLLPAPHMIRAQNAELGSNEEQNEGHEDDDDAQAQGPPPNRSRQLSSGSFMNLGSITLNASFKRVSRWWRNAREDSGNEPPSGSTSQLELPSLLSDPVSSEEIVSNTLVPSSQRSLLSSSSTFPQGSTSISAFSIRSMFGSISNLSINRSDGFASMILTRGFTAIPYGWHAEGDGLDNVVRFPQATKPSTLGSKFAVLQFADLMVGQEPDE
ncbi:hypothetical protein MVEG_07855 [Podila verticillata NRRL 6337]|nr:hypothetical protein MVEG_07855 [Podila verticillata NRRL 6337]